MRKLPSASTWLDNPSMEKLSLGWGRPVVQRSWGLLGKVLQYLAGLTVLLDLAGEARVEAVHARVGRASRWTVDHIKTLLPGTLDAVWRRLAGPSRLGGILIYL